MANIKEAFAATATSTAITCTLTSLGTGAARQSTAVDNSTNLFVDVLVRVKTNGQAGGTGTLDVYAVGALETGTPIYTDGASGTDGAFSGSILNARLLGNVAMNAATSVTGGPYSLSRCFDGNIPVKWALICVNSSGAVLSATAADHALAYQGVYATAV
jgi:hypothetical protein